MKGLFSNSTDPKFNLATEEYLLRNSDEDVFFLYVNSPSIIVGKHQNTLAEINLDFVQASDIAVHRRLSGGGTVYHDEGNLNFCFILNGEKGKLVDFAKHTQPIIKALKEYNIAAELGKRHDILIEGKKVSGNASHVYKNRVMHHGTLLFNSNLDVLNQVLKTNPLAIIHKAVKSVRSEVTNISNYLTGESNFKIFSAHIFSYLLKHFSNSISYHLNSQEQAIILKLADEKYNSWEWNYGYSPTYEVKKRIRTESNLRIENQFQVEKGIIQQIHIKSQNNFYDSYISFLTKLLIGAKHDPNHINNKLNTINKLPHPHLSIEKTLKLFF